MIMFLTKKEEKILQLKIYILRRKRTHGFHQKTLITVERFFRIGSQINQLFLTSRFFKFIVA